MKFINGICFCLMNLLLFLSACGPSKTIDDSLQHVPGDISSVTAFNIKQLSQKVTLDYIQSLQFYKDEIKGLTARDPILASIIDKPIDSGIDLKKNFYFIVDVDPNFPKEKFYGFVLSIADLPLFETMLKQTDIGEFQKGNQYNFVVKRDHLIAWDETFVILGSGGRSFDASQELPRFFNINPEQSIANNADLKKCLSEEYDIATWISSDFLAKNEDLKVAASFIGISNEALQANYIHSYLNFNEGNIIANSIHFLQKELTNDLKLFFKNGIDQNVSKYIPADDLGVLVTAALDSKGIYQVISEKVGGYAMANKALKEFGFTAKDISEAFGGDIVLGLYGNSNGNETSETLITSNINDQDIFGKFIDLAKQFDIIEKQEENLYLIKDKEAKLFINKTNAASYLLVKNDIFFITANESIIQTIKGGGYRSADQVDASIYKNISSNSLGTYIDLEKYKRLFTALKKDQQTFTNVKMRADLKKASIKVEMVDKNRNSLKAILKLMNEIYLSEKGEKANPNI